ncbi:pterin-4-alpha-carbinolamine dehydratase [Thiohalorhabdus methylotrophus]|uniref:Pterin-4-alpha-carbinolamine dehydratase n=1 Tax=Thiohalorhabdus methylotrophus TaxID=3242694 RepID=A0ABV4TXB9_9GAMM
MTEHWSEIQRPPRLEARFDFPDYSTLRAFLDEAADLSEEKELFADMSFDRNSVRLKIHPPEGEEKLSEAERAYASGLEQLALDRLAIEG